MNNVARVAVVDCAQNLQHDSLGVTFGEAFSLNDLIKKFTAGTELGYEIKVGVVLENFKQSDDSWVIQLF